MRFLFNEITQSIMKKIDGIFFPAGWFVKELNENGLGEILICFFFGAFCLTA